MVAGALACDPSATNPTEDSAIPAGQAQLLLAVNVAATSISTLVVEVTAPDITTPLIFNIEESGGVATGTLTIPAGSDRTVTVRAFDSNGIETHRGSITINVVEGTNPNVSITLLPLTGQQPVTASFGSFAVIVDPPSATVAVGATVQLTATVLDANGDPTGDAVTWATANPGIAGVDASGLVTGNAEGDAEIVATFNGVGGNATITVTTVSPNAFLFAWGTNGSAPGQLAAPMDVAVASDGTVYVVEFINNRVQRFDANGQSLSICGTAGAGPGEFSGPVGIAVHDASAVVYVADQANNRVQKFDTNGQFMLEWGSFGTGPGQFSWPQGVAVDASGEVYVTDSHRVQVFSPDGVLLRAWGSSGTGDGQFVTPMALAIADDGTVYVPDFDNNRVQKFTSDGVFLGKWGTPGTGDGQFSQPTGVAVDLNGNVYVAEQFPSRIQRFDTNGQFLSKWGSMGPGDGQFNGLRGLAVDAAGNVYVADVNNHRIQKFGPA